MSKPTAPILRTHPLTGAPIVPIGTRPDGSPLWPILGGSPDAPAGGQPTTPPAGAPPAGDPPGAPGSPPKEDPPAGGPSGGVDLSKLTAEELKKHPSFQTETNRIVQERLTREKQKWQAELDKERERAGLDEAGKLQAQLEDERTKAQQAAAERQAAFQLVARTKAEVLAIAEGGRADRAAAIVGQADLAGAVNEDGTVSEAVLRAAVVKVLEAYPEWKAQPGAPRSGGELPPGGGGGKTFTKSQIEAMSAEERVERFEEIQQAIEDGRFVHNA